MLVHTPLIKDLPNPNKQTKINPVTRTATTTKFKKYKSHHVSLSEEFTFYTCQTKLGCGVGLGSGGGREGADEQRHKKLKLEGPRNIVTKEEYSSVWTQKREKSFQCWLKERDQVLTFS